MYVVHARRRQAAVLVLTSLMLVLFVGLAALAVDLGWVYVSEARLQRASNAAAASAANTLYNGGTTAKARTSAEGFALSNGFALVDTNVQVNPYSNNSGLTEISVQSTVPLFFAGLIGWRSLPVGYSCYAQANDTETVLYAAPPVAKTPSGLIPIYVAHADMLPVVAGTATTKAQLAALIFGSGQSFTVGKDYLIKTGDQLSGKLKNITGQSTGQHQGILQLDPPGGTMNYQTSLQYGYGGGVAIDDQIVSTEGPQGPPTQQAWQARYNQDPLTLEAAAQPFSARMVVVPIVCAMSSGLNDMGTGVANYTYLPYAHTGQLNVQVIGFGRFFLDLPVNTYGNGAISGVFSGYVGTPPSGQSKG